MIKEETKRILRIQGELIPLSPNATAIVDQLLQVILKRLKERVSRLKLERAVKSRTESDSEFALRSGLIEGTNETLDLVLIILDEELKT